RARNAREGRRARGRGRAGARARPALRRDEGARVPSRWEFGAPVVAGGERGTMTKTRVALFPGSFDPFTNGHLDLPRRASALFGPVVSAVAETSARSSLFTPAERVEMIESAIRGLKGASATHFSGLLVDCARRIGAQAIIRGLRAVSDFEFEFQMALMNR